MLPLGHVTLCAVCRERRRRRGGSSGGAGRGAVGAVAGAAAGRGAAERVRRAAHVWTRSLVQAAAAARSVALGRGTRNRRAAAEPLRDLRGDGAGDSRSAQRTRMHMVHRHHPGHAGGMAPRQCTVLVPLRLVQNACLRQVIVPPRSLSAMCMRVASRHDWDGGSGDAAEHAVGDR